MYKRIIFYILQAIKLHELSTSSKLPTISSNHRRTPTHTGPLYAHNSQEEIISKRPLTLHLVGALNGALYSNSLRTPFGSEHSISFSKRSQLYKGDPICFSHFCIRDNYLSNHEESIHSPEFTIYKIK